MTLVSSPKIYWNLLNIWLKFLHQFQPAITRSLSFARTRMSSWTTSPPQTPTWDFKHPHHVLLSSNPPYKLPLNFSKVFSSSNRPPFLVCVIYSIKNSSPKSFREKPFCSLFLFCMFFLHNFSLLLNENNRRLSLIGFEKWNRRNKYKKRSWKSWDVEKFFCWSKSISFKFMLILLISKCWMGIGAAAHWARYHLRMCDGA